MLVSFELNLSSRCFKVLGFDTYIDGFQILRYNLTTAYIPHMTLPVASLTTTSPVPKAGNRFATILLYMSDLGEHDGGETVFAKAWPHGQDEKDRVQLPEVSVRVHGRKYRNPVLYFQHRFVFTFVGFGTALRESGGTGVLDPGSSEEEMVSLLGVGFTFNMLYAV